MDIKTNYSFIIKISLPIVILLGIVIIGYGIGIGIEGIKTIDIILLTVFAIIELSIVFLIFVVAFCKLPVCRFTSEKIIEYDKKGNLVNEISICDIQTIHYYPFKWRYLVTIFFGVLHEGGVWKLHISFKNGEKISLGFFAEIDVKKLKTELYNDLIEFF